MPTLAHFKEAAKHKGIARHKVTRQALQLSPRTLQLLELSPEVMNEFEIELPKSAYTIDKMDVAGWAELFGNPCQKQVR